MQISKSDFHQYLSEYTEDEIFYRNIYLQKKEHPETFQEYLHSLDPDYIRDQRLYVPELRQDHGSLSWRERYVRKHSREYHYQQALPLYSGVYP